MSLWLKGEDEGNVKLSKMIIAANGAVGAGSLQGNLHVICDLMSAWRDRQHVWP